MSAFSFDIDPDITRAWTPPAALYRDPAAYSAVRERVFARSWQLVPMPPRAARSASPLTLLPGCLDEPLVATEDDGGTVRLLSNVCTHRGNVVCAKPQTSGELRCGYHARRFGLDGSFKSMPEFEGAANFPSPRDSLPALPLERWGPLAFTSLAPSVPFERWLGPVRQRMPWLPIGELREDPSRARSYAFDANWALYCDNYLEGFHIPFVHAGLNAAIEWSDYTTESGDGWVLQIGDAKPRELAFDLPAGSPDHGRRVAAYWWFLFPNLMLNFYPWGLSVNVVEPQGHARVRVRYSTFVWKPELVGLGAGADLGRVEEEDQQVVLGVQRGIQSRLYDRGRYSPTREQGTHAFHRMLAAALRG